MATCPQAFFTAYVEAALWSSTGPDDAPLDQDHDASDIAPETLDRMLADCNAFWAAMSGHIADCEAMQANLTSPEEQAGHDFWLTRCGHGAGFWDGDWPEPHATTLDNAAKAFGNVDLYVGDDGLIYA